jgi:ResB-like family
MSLEAASLPSVEPVKKNSSFAIFPLLSRVFDFFASLELAVFLILALALVLAAGTVYESKYGAAVASREVYRSLWMQLLLWLFMLNLAAAALSRLPWKSQHVGFLVTHLGIIILLLGSWVTQRRGIDASVALGAGESTRSARIDQSVINLFRATGGKAYELLLSQPVDFDPRRPLASPQAFPYAGSAGPRELKVLQYLPKASREVRAEDAKSGQGVPGLKFRLTGSRATFSDWLFLQTDTPSTRRSVGPAEFRFESGKPALAGKKAEKATVILHLDGNPALPPSLAVARAGEAFRELGRVQIGKAIPLGWMDFALVVDEYHPSAFPRTEYQALDPSIPVPEPLEAVQVDLDGQKLWLEMGSSGQLSLGDSLYYVQYSKKEVDLGFDLTLKKFQIGYYEGTERPKSYSSEVEAMGKSSTISMNEPLKQNGFTIYQSSYEMDSDGMPKYSVLTVNYDPGRATKYAGSLMTVLGIILMFYFKPVYSGKNRWLGKNSGAAGEGV